MELPVIWLDSAVGAAVPAGLRGPHVDLQLLEVLHLEMGVEGAWPRNDQLFHVAVLKNFYQTFLGFRCDINS